MKNTKTKSIVALAIVLVLTVVFGIVGVTGMSFQGGLYRRHVTRIQSSDESCALYGSTCNPW